MHAVHFVITGWSLGEHQEWSKYSTFEVSTRVPLVVYVPGVTDSGTSQHTFSFSDVFKLTKSHAVSYRNKSKPCIRDRTKTKSNQIYTDNPFIVSDALVELVDVFPSICDLAGIAVPQLCPKHSKKIRLCTEGVSFSPIISKIDKTTKDFTWKKAAFSQYPRPSYYPREDSDKPKLANITIMGYSMRTSHYRYTEWVTFDKNKFIGDFSQVYARELYIHDTDYGENNNVAYESTYYELVHNASRKLQKGWKHALPIYVKTQQTATETGS